jgi:hypothetical protein
MHLSFTSASSVYSNNIKISSEIHKIGHFFPSENVHQLTPISGIWETAKCSFMGKLP